MKKLLTLLFSLCLLNAFGQLTSLKTVVIAPSATSGHTGTDYTVSLIRDWTAYPNTDKGLDDWKKAIARGTFDLTTTAGCVIAAGTKPPVIQPTCTVTVTQPTTTTTTVTIPAFSQQIATADGSGTGSLIDGGGSYYGSYGDNTQYRQYDLTAPVTDNNYDLAIHYKTNTTTTGHGNVVINSVSTQFNLEGAEGGTRTAHATIALAAGANTIRVEGKDGTPFFSDYVTVTRAASTSVVSTTTTGTTSTTTNPTSNTTNNTSNGTFAAGFGEGTLSELMAYAPFVPGNNNQVSSWMVGNTTQYITTSAGLKVSINNAIGASVTHLSLNGGENKINTNAEQTSYFRGVKSPDNGRSQSISTYGNPDGFNGGTNGRFGDTNLDGNYVLSSTIGWNAVPGGQAGNVHRSEVIYYERRTVVGYGDVLYTKVQPYQWGMENTLAKQYLHMFTWGEGQAMGWFAVVENFRNDSQMLYVEREQEKPFVFPIATHYQKATYTGNAPGTGGGLTYFNNSQPCEGAGTADCPNHNDSGDFIGAENWVGALTGDNSQIVALVTPYNTRFRGKQEQSWSGNEFTNATSYINSAVLENYDQASIRAFSGFIYMGAPAQFRQWLYAKNLATTPFSWSFSAGKTGGWHSGNSYARMNSANRYEWNIGKRGADPNVAGEQPSMKGHFGSPYGAWQASTIPTLYIKGTFSSSSLSAIRIEFKKPGSGNGTVYSTSAIPIQADGQEHTYSVNMSGVSGWNGIVSFIDIKPNNPTDASSGSETFVPSYIGNVNPN